MKIIYRLIAAASALSLLAVETAVAQDKYPEKPIRMVVPFSSGSASDFLARTLQVKLSEIYGQQIVIDNRPGAGGIIGSTLIAKGAPDGYTVGMIGQPHLMQPLMQKEPPYHPINDIATVTQVASLPNVLVVSPGLPVKTVADLIALAKSKPGDLNFGSLGIGASSHIAGEAFKTAAGINVVHVPFKSVGDIFTEMVAGRVHLYMFPLPAVMPMLKDGKLHVLAAGTPQRTPSLPGVPTISESGLPGFQSMSWFGVVAPSKTSRAIVMKLNKDIGGILATADTKERFLRQGADAVYGTPEDFRKLMEAEYAKYQKLVKDSGISAQ
jgi:tripartite-type tricarboxylate transporter receptor subunit TctC